jgi:preprotein translocase subunit Sec63
MARQGDYFEFLGIAPEATSFEVRRAAEHVRTRFDPDRFIDPAFSDVRAALSEILEVVSEAESVLSDDALRLGYIKSVMARRSSRTPPRGEA